MAARNVTGPLPLSPSPEANSDTSISKQRLDSLISAGAATGYTIITSTGSLEAAGGTFVPVLLHKKDRTVQLLQEFSLPFRTADKEPQNYDLFGHKLQVIYQTQTSYCAVSQHRQLGLAVGSLTHGLLLLTFDRSTQPRQAVNLLEGLRT